MVAKGEVPIEQPTAFCTLLDRFTEELKEQHDHDLKDVIVAAQAEKKVLVQELRQLRELCSCHCSTSCKSLWKQDEELPEMPRRQLEAVPMHSAMDDLDEEESTPSSDEMPVNEDLDIVEDVEDWDEDYPSALPNGVLPGGASGSSGPAVADVPEPPPMPRIVKAPENEDTRLFVAPSALTSARSSCAVAEISTHQEDTEDGMLSTKSEEKAEAPQDFISQIQATLRQHSEKATGVNLKDPSAKKSPMLVSPTSSSGGALRLGSPQASGHRPSWGGLETKEYTPGTEITSAAEKAEETQSDLEEDPSRATSEGSLQSKFKKRSYSMDGSSRRHSHHHEKEHKRKSKTDTGGLHDLSSLPELPGGSALDTSHCDTDHKVRGSGRLSLDVTCMRHNELSLHPALQIATPDANASATRRVTWCGNDAPGAQPGMPGFQPAPQPATQTVVIEEEEAEEDAIEMLAIWKMRRKSTSNMGSSRQRGRGSGANLNNSHLKRSSKTDLENMQEQESEWEQNCVFRRLSGMVSKPSSAKRLAWDIIGVLLIGYDLFWIPMQAFDPEKVTFTEFMSWFTTSFWTIDIPCSFLVGFHREGILEMRLNRIARHYTKTWLPFDIIVMSVDWALSLVDIVSENALKNSSVGGVGYMRLGKAIRFLRLLRLLRLLKAAGVVSELIERIQSESHLIIIGIVKLLVFIMMINHLIACAWFGIGSAGWDTTHNWTTVNLLSERSLGYKYLTSLHWSLTQFTPASMEVVPENALERAFTVLIILSAMIVFSSFVSAITNAMTQLRNLNSERNEQFSSLRRYLGENKCSTALMGRIWTCVQTAMGRTKRRMHEADVKVLQLLPWSLKAELLEEVYNPILNAHPFFNQFSAAFQVQMRKIFQNAVEEISLPIGQELFSSGEVAANMYFVLAGVLVYTKDNKSSCEPPCFVSAGQWVSEAALWIKWKHNGQLIGTTPCELIALKAAKVQDVLSHLSYDEDQVKRYVKIFVRYFKKNPDSLNDVWAETDLLSDMVQKAFLGDDMDDEDAGGLGMGAHKSLGKNAAGGGGFSGWAARRQSIASSRTVNTDASGSQAKRRQSFFVGGMQSLFGRGGGQMQTQVESENSESSSSDSDEDSDEEDSEDEEDDGVIKEGDEDEDEEEVRKSDSDGSAASGEHADKEPVKKDSVTTAPPSLQGLQGGSPPGALSNSRRPSAAGLPTGGRRMSLGGGALSNSRRPSVTAADMAMLPQAVLDNMVKQEAASSPSQPKRRASNAGRRTSNAGPLAPLGGLQDKVEADATKSPALIDEAMLKSDGGSVEDANDGSPTRSKSPGSRSGSKEAPRRGSKEAPRRGSKEASPASHRGSHAEVNGRGSKRRSQGSNRRYGSRGSNEDAEAEALEDDDKVATEIEASFSPKKSRDSEEKRKKMKASRTDSLYSMCDDEIDRFLERAKHKKRVETIEESEEPVSFPMKLLNVLRTSNADHGACKRSSKDGGPRGSNDSGRGRRGSTASDAPAGGRGSLPVTSRVSMDSQDPRRSTGRSWLPTFSSSTCFSQSNNRDSASGNNTGFGRWFGKTPSNGTSPKQSVVPS